MFLIAFVYFSMARFMGKACSLSGTFLILSLATFPGLSLLQAQVEEGTESPLPAEVVKLREAMNERIKLQTQTLKLQYASALEKLEKEVTLQGDFEQAFKAQQRRRQLTHPFGSLSPAATRSDSIFLLPKDARVNGSTNLDKKNGTLTGWKTVGSNAQWNLMSIDPGEYTVMLYYAVGTPEVSRRISATLDEPLTSGGDIVFFQDSNLSRDSNELSKTLEFTGGWDSFHALKLGDITVKTSSAEFVLESKSSALGGLMVCQGMEFIPKKETGGVPSDLVVLTNLKAEHSKKVISSKQPLVRDYVDKLEELEKLALQDEKLAPFIPLLKKEVARAMEAGKGLTHDPDSEFSLSLPAASNDGSSEKEEANLGQGTPFAGGRQLLRNVTYIPHPSNTGTSFRVKVQDVEYPVKVSYILSPPPNQNDGNKVEKAAGYFGLNQHDAVEIGRAALKYTSTVLSDRAFTLKTNAKKDQEGNYLVELRLGSLGNFAKILVARGFAAVQNAKDLKEEESENAGMLELLKGYEKKARQEKEGAWGLSGADENE